MLVKLVTLRFDPRLGGFDEGPLQAALRGREVTSIREHFFIHDNVPYWTFMVAGRIPDSDGEPVSVRSEDPAREGGGYREILRAEDWALFNTLRDWRSGVAGKEGVPPYIIVPNEALARIARERPATLTALGAIRGMGAARIKRHGRSLLAALGAPNAASGSQAAAGQGAGFAGDDGEAPVPDARPGSAGEPPEGGPEGGDGGVASAAGREGGNAAP